MPTRYRHKVELEINGEVTVSRSVYHTGLKETLKNLKIIAKRTTSPYYIYVTKRSRVNSIIKTLRDDTEITI